MAERWTLEPNGAAFDFYRDDMPERRFILVGMTYNSAGELQGYADRIVKAFNEAERREAEGRAA